MCLWPCVLEQEEAPPTLKINTNYSGRVPQPCSVALKLGRWSDCRFTPASSNFHSSSFIFSCIFFCSSDCSFLRCFWFRRSAQSLCSISSREAFLSFFLSNSSSLFPFLSSLPLLCLFQRFFVVSAVPAPEVSAPALEFLALELLFLDASLRDLVESKEAVMLQATASPSQLRFVPRRRSRLGQSARTRGPGCTC